MKKFDDWLKAPAGEKTPVFSFKKPSDVFVPSAFVPSVVERKINANHPPDTPPPTQNEDIKAKRLRRNARQNLLRRRRRMVPIYFHRSLLDRM